MDYEKYEKECNRIQQDNIQLLDEFGAWLERKGLADSTIQKHISNIEFYINHFLLYEDTVEARDGALKIGNTSRKSLIQSCISLIVGYFLTTF